MKRLSAALVIAFLISLFSACSPASEIVYSDKEKGDYVKYVNVKEKKPYNVVNAQILLLNETGLLDRTAVVVKGKILSEKEIAMEEYIDNKLHYIYYADIFEVNVSKVFGGNEQEIKAGDTLEIGNGCCSHFWLEGAIKMETGEEYILFLKNTRDSATVEFSKYAKYYVTRSLQSIITINNGIYTFDKVFESLGKDASIVEAKEAKWLKRYEKANLEDELDDFLKQKLR